MVYYFYMKKTLFFSLLLSAICRPLSATEYVCEVASVEGVAHVASAETSQQPAKSGDILRAGDVLETGPGGVVDLAFDPERNNVVRVEGDSLLRITKIFPARLHLNKGAALARLEALPKNSKFQLITPTAVAAARGTIFRTSYSPDVGTQIFNLSKSKVEVYRVDAQGLASGKSFFIDYGQVIQYPLIPFPGIDEAPANMTGEQFKDTKKSMGDLEARLAEVKTVTPAAQIPQPPDQGLAVSDDENWRVTYLRRGELEDATSFDPSTGMADVVEANTELSPNQMFCLEDGAGAEVMNTKTGERYFMSGPFAGTAHSIPQSGGTKQDYSKTKVLALEGSVQTETYLSGGEGEAPVKVSELLLEAGKPFSKSGGPVNESKVTPCGYVKKVKNPCQEQVYEFLWAKGDIAMPTYDKENPPPLLLPRPKKRGSLDGQETEETDV